MALFAAMNNRIALARLSHQRDSAKARRFKARPTQSIQPTAASSARTFEFVVARPIDAWAVHTVFIWSFESMSSAIPLPFRPCRVKFAIDQSLLMPAEARWVLQVLLGLSLDSQSVQIVDVMGNRSECPRAPATTSSLTAPRTQVLDKLVSHVSKYLAQYDIAALLTHVDDFSTRVKARVSSGCRPSASCEESRRSCVRQGAWT
jgi:hypothetical protein